MNVNVTFQIINTQKLLENVILVTLYVTIFQNVLQQPKIVVPQKSTLMHISLYVLLLELRLHLKVIS